MRRILVDRARDRQRQKRGGGRRRVRINLDSLLDGPPDDDLLDFDDVLHKLAREDPATDPKRERQQEVTHEVSR
jgi:RNA polymerase sigma-70 factor, ECF subfamily